VQVQGNPAGRREQTVKLDAAPVEVAARRRAGAAREREQDAWLRPMTAFPGRNCAEQPMV
jgi:hypothetical protein